MRPQNCFHLRELPKDYSLEQSLSNLYCHGTSSRNRGQRVACRTDWDNLLYVVSNAEQPTLSTDCLHGTIPRICRNLH